MPESSVHGWQTMSGGKAIFLIQATITASSLAKYEYCIMTTLTIEMPDTVLSALRLNPQEFPREMHIAAAVQWYAKQQISQGKAAEIAGLCRAEFIEELFKRKVPACQVTIEELMEETKDDDE
jgi:predicted HTH domain antitoxin